MAEDDPLMSRMYKRAIKIAGFDLEEATDGEAAIVTLQSMKTKPDVALVDVMMPKKSGYDVLRAMKEDDSLKTIPVIMLSNLAGPEDVQKGIDLGAAAYLIKSQYSPKELLLKVQDIVAKVKNK